MQRDFVGSLGIKKCCPHICYKFFNGVPDLEGVVLVAEWHKIKKGRIAHVESAFDGRPFAAMFAGAES